MFIYSPRFFSQAILPIHHSRALAKTARGTATPPLLIGHERQDDDGEDLCAAGGSAHPCFRVPGFSRLYRGDCRRLSLDQSRDGRHRAQILGRDVRRRDHDIEFGFDREHELDHG
jgi:hypothetical protein